MYRTAAGLLTGIQLSEKVFDLTKSLSHNIFHAEWLIFSKAMSHHCPPSGPCRTADIEGESRANASSERNPAALDGFAINGSGLVGK